MKKIKFIAIAAVLTFGIGGAVIASNNMQTANVQNNAPLGQPEDWQPLSPGHKGCDDANTRACIGYQDPVTSEVTILTFGNERP